MTTEFILLFGIDAENNYYVDIKCLFAGFEISCTAVSNIYYLCMGFSIILYLDHLEAKMVLV